MGLSVLIVEDEPAILELIAFTCQSSGIDVSRAANVAEAKKCLEHKEPDLILLDWMLPDRPGIDWLRELRKDEYFHDVPVIMLTARGLEEDKVAGLNNGADDYIVKPFSPKELVARIKAVVRRHGDGEENVLTCGPLKMDKNKFEVTVDKKVLKLSVVEFNLLSLFAQHPGRVYSRQQIIDKVWGYDSSIDERTIDVHMLRLRKHLASTSMKDFIETIRGLGYKGVKPLVTASL
ncbi:MAG: response regulator [Burkholderiales bacterium]|nr:response regulator [Burkholderiales bacterium]